MAMGWALNQGKGSSFAPKLFPQAPVEITPQVPEADALAVAIREALEPVASLEDTWSLDEMCSRVAKYLSKATNKFWKDERLLSRGSPAHAQAFVADFVDSVLGAMSNALWDKAWFPETNFSGCIFEALMTLCKGSKLFCRVMLPCVLQYVEEGAVRFREECRIGDVLTAVIAGSGLPPLQHKKAAAHLQNSYDEAYTTAPYGSFPTEDPSTQLLKDFVLGWVRSFVGRAFQLLENGVGPDKSEQMTFVTALFQQVVGPEARCLPIELVNDFGKPESTGVLPDAGWLFVAEATEAVFAEIEEQVTARPLKMPRTGGAGQGKWAGAGQGAGPWTGGAKQVKAPIKLQWLTES